ncbi:flagellar basal body L-ring protein FlgH [Gammaproteobacteria bacterium AB-CW1]|uniref:Flagellar L-ring protein n=1 Tax=Natronospira elongata TaxID=3110268 RepID=A0AAP6JCE6_9GAMM|nr:flagellar basal body L-ring protein FlgH [Gammaproteobacteria bacterium AB-CW1]
MTGVSRQHRQVSLGRQGLAALMLLIIAAFLAGCAGQAPRDDERSYEPVMPEEPAESERVSGSIFQAAYASSLVEDRRARRVGDILTIRLVERTDASKSMNTNTSRDSSTSMQPPTLFGRGVTHRGRPILETEMGSSRSFEGGGESSQSNRLEGEITVTVARRLPNGNLMVQGEKWLTLNQGEEMVRIAGIIRPQDIASDNSVPSNRVADARITYSGTGSLANANQPGWLTRFFQSPLSPL